MRGRAAISRSAVSALSALRAYWGTATLAAVTGAVALAAAVPVTRLARWSAGVDTRLRLAVARPFDAGFHWIRAAAGPVELRQETVLLLFKLLFGVVCGLVAVALLTLLAVFLARASARAPEIAVRRAVGASTSVLLSAQLVEGALVASASLLWGGVMGLAAGRVLSGAWPGSLGLTAGNVSEIVALIVTGTIGVGALLPVALVRRPARSSTVDPTSLALVIPAVQLGLSLTVLATASMLRLGAERVAPLGRAARGGVQVYEIDAAGLPLAERAAGYTEVLRRLQADGVASASLSSPGALVGLGRVAEALSDSAYYAVYHLLSAGSFQALGLHLVGGREFTDADGWLAPRVAIVSRSLAARLAHLGGRVLLGYGPDAAHAVVGIADDAPRAGLGGANEPRFVVYTSMLQHPAANVELVVRAEYGAPAPAEVRGVVQASLGAGASVWGPESEASVFAAEARPLSWFARAFTAEGVAILVTASLGTFAVMWLWVTSLFGELGLRRAVGARRRAILRYVLVRAAAVAVAGSAFGVWLGMMIWDSVHLLAASLPSWDPVAVGWSSAVLGGASLSGAVIPAWRAARTPPATLMEDCEP